MVYIFNFDKNSKFNSSHSPGDLYDCVKREIVLTLMMNKSFKGAPII